MAEEHPHTLELVARHLIKATQPLVDAAESRGAFMRLMSRIGIFASDIPAPYAQLATATGSATLRIAAGVILATVSRLAQMVLRVARPIVPRAANCR